MLVSFEHPRVEQVAFSTASAADRKAAQSVNSCMHGVCRQSRPEKYVWLRIALTKLTTEAVKRE